MMDSKTTNDFLAINYRKTVCQNSVEGAFSYDFRRVAPCEEVRLWSHLVSTWSLVKIVWFMDSLTSDQIRGEVSPIRGTNLSRMSGHDIHLWKPGIFFRNQNLLLFRPVVWFQDNNPEIDLCLHSPGFVVVITLGVAVGSHCLEW